MMWIVTIGGGKSDYNLERDPGKICSHLIKWQLTKWKLDLFIGTTE
jgi:hypothetical protein